MSVDAIMISFRATWYYVQASTPDLRYSDRVPALPDDGAMLGTRLWSCCHVVEVLMLFAPKFIYPSIRQRAKFGATVHRDKSILSSGLLDKALAG